MAKYIITNELILVNGVDLSDHVRSVNTTDERAEVDVTAQGATNTQTAKGLGDAAIEIEFYQDFTAGKVHATLSPLIASTTPFAVEIRPVNAARSATNPATLLSSALLFNYPALAGSVGDASTMTVTFKNSDSGPGMTYPTS